jgi:hypothetical protein
VDELDVGQQNTMNQSKIATQILNMLDEHKRKATLLKVTLLLVLSFVVFLWANRWDSPLAVIPRTFFAVLLGYLLLYRQSIRLYSHIAHYFDIEALKRDAQQSPPPIPSTDDEHHR